MLPRELPTGWKEVQIGEVLKFEYGKGLPKDRRKKNGEFPVYGSSGIVGYHNHYLVNEECIVVGRKGSIGSVFLSLNPCWPIDTTYYVKNVSSLNIKFLYHQLSYINLKIVEKSTAIPGLSRDDINARRIILPPLEEQRQIVEIIEELFSELNAGRRQLELVKEQLKTYRQAVLKHAFCGKLTDNRIKDGELPESWKIEKFIDFCKIQRGYDLPLKELKTGIFPVVTSGGIKGYHNDFKALGPCLITGRSGGVGNIHYVEIDKYWPHNTVLFVKDFCGNNPKFMYYYFLQFNFEAFSASTTIPTLDRKQLYKELVKVPPVIQQEQIVKEVESRFQVSLRLENAVENAISKVESLKQVILRQAFEGKLVKTQTN